MGGACNMVTVPMAGFDKYLLGSKRNYYLVRWLVVGDVEMGDIGEYAADFTDEGDDPQEYAADFTDEEDG